MVTAETDEWRMGNFTEMEYFYGIPLYSRDHRASISFSKTLSLTPQLNAPSAEDMKES